MPVTSLLFALLLTIAIELSVLLLLRERRRRVLWGSVAVNVCTNVPLNLYLLFVSHSTSAIVVGELLVLVVEALFYAVLGVGVRRAALYSFLCNAISFLTGLLLQSLLWLLFHVTL